MSNEFENTKNALVIKLCGEIDQYASAELKEKIDLELQYSKKRNLIIDLSDVTLMDSSGIGLIVGRYKTAKALGGTIALCGANPSVEKVIELSGIKKVISSFSNLLQADKFLKENNESERNDI